MKNLIKLGFLALLVGVPALTLLTGWGAGLLIAKWSVTLYATVAIAAILAVAFTLYSAKHYRGEDFGEKHHKWLLARAAQDAKFTALQKHFHGLRAIPSAVLLLAIGMPLSATLVILVSMGFYLTDGLVARYADVYGRSATTAGRTRSAHP